MTVRGVPAGVAQASRALESCDSLWIIPMLCTPFRRAFFSRLLLVRRRGAAMRAMVLLMSACTRRDRPTADSPTAKAPAPVSKTDRAQVSVMLAGSAGDKWTIPAKARSDDERAAADTFELVSVGTSALPVTDIVSLGNFSCAGLLTSGRYILDGNRNYLWAYSRDHGKPTNPL